MTRLRILLFAVALLGLALAGSRLGGAIPEFSDWVDRSGVWGVLVFVAGYAVGTLAFVPGSIMTMAAGVVFGVAQGTVYAFSGALAGSTAAFLVARYVARPAVEKHIGGRPRFARIDRAVAARGRRIVILLRLSPVVPFNLLNYALGLTRVRLADYVVASIAMLPGTLAYVYSGSLIGDVAAIAGGAEVRRSTGHWLMLVAGLVATIGVTVYITRLARRALRNEEMLDENA